MNVINVIFSQTHRVPMMAYIKSKRWPKKKVCFSSANIYWPINTNTKTNPNHQCNYKDRIVQLVIILYSFLYKNILRCSRKYDHISGAGLVGIKILLKMISYTLVKIYCMMHSCNFVACNIVKGATVRKIINAIFSFDCGYGNEREKPISLTNMFWYMRYHRFPFYLL